MKLLYGIFGALLSVGGTHIMAMVPAKVGNFWLDAGEHAQLVVSYTIPIKIMDADHKIIESSKKQDFNINLGKLSAFALSPKEMTEKIQDGLSKKFKDMPDQELIKQTGSATFGRDASKWVITLDDKPFESYAKDAVVVNDVKKMETIYAKGVQAKYVEAPVQPAQPQPAIAPTPVLPAGAPLVQAPMTPAPVTPVLVQPTPALPGAPVQPLTPVPQVEAPVALPVPPELMKKD